MKSKSRIGALLVALVLGGCGESGLLGPDPATVPNAPGSANVEHRNVVVAAAGLQFQPTILPIAIPVPSPADILEAKLVWAGRGATSTGDPTIVVNGVQYTGNLVASYEVPVEPRWVFFYELDAAGIVAPGNNLLFVGDVLLDGRASGVAVAVVYRDPGAPWTSVRIVQPSEFVHGDSPGREHGEVHSFALAPSPATETARLVVVAADCLASLPDRTWWYAGGGAVPADLVGSGTVFSNRFNSAFGARMDVLQESALVVPPGADHVAYQLESPAGGDGIMHVLGVVCTTGEEAACSGTIAGLVWHDADRDGTAGSGEPGLADVRVELTNSTGGSVGDVLTDSAGRFSFDTLCAGEWVVEVDPSTLPDGFAATTCGGGDCSPVTVTQDGISIVELAFGWAAPPEPPGPVCFFGPGWWKHEVDVAAGLNPGRGKLPPGMVQNLLAVAAASTSTDFGGGDGTLAPAEASAILHGQGDACERAERHYLVSLLNFAFNGANRAVPVDTDGDDVPDMTLGEALDLIESLLGGARGSADCRMAQGVATSVNENRDPRCTFPQ